MASHEYPKFVSISDYLAGEESSGIKHEYLGGIIHAMAGGSNRHNTIPLPEIDTQLTLAELFENAGG